MACAVVTVGTCVAAAAAAAEAAEVAAGSYAGAAVIYAAVAASAWFALAGRSTSEGPVHDKDRQALAVPAAEHASGLLENA